MVVACDALTWGEPGLPTMSKNDKILMWVIITAAAYFPLRVLVGLW